MLPGLLSLLLLACQSTSTVLPAVVRSSGLQEQVEYVQFGDRQPSSTNSQYQIAGTCNGLPRVKVSTAPGFCLGLVDCGDGMVMPRQSLVLNPSQLLVTDMGGWNPNNGKLYLLTRKGNQFQRQTLLDGKTLPAEWKKLMDRPHTILKGPDQKVWIGSATTIYSLDPAASNLLSTVQVRLDALPSDGLHPLKAFVFDDASHLYLNMGAATNNCQASGVPANSVAKACQEGETNALIRKYNLQADGTLNPRFEVFAKGLRNSVAMVWSPDHQALIQGENSRDAINKADPHLDDATTPNDEVNVVREGKHYGWPYCYNSGLTSPEFPGFDCGSYEKPKILLPAHSAPLSILSYSGSLFPKWYQGRLLFALHGYREKGHRIVAFLRDDQGLPTGKPLSVVYGWDARGDQALGSPVSLSLSPDGSVYITEDKSRKVLQLYYDPQKGDGKPVSELGSVADPQPATPSSEDETLRKSFEERLHAPNVPLFTRIQDQLIHRNCVQCHGGAAFPGIQMKMFDDRGNARNFLAAREGRSPLVVPNQPMQSELYQRLLGINGQPQMPPMGFSSSQEQQSLAELVKQWIEAGAPLP